MTPCSAVEPSHCWVTAVDLAVCGLLAFKGVAGYNSSVFVPVWLLFLLQRARSGVNPTMERCTVTSTYLGFGQE